MSDTIALLATKWYAVVDDCIGGWAVANTDKPTSQLDHKIGEWEIGNFLTQEIAEHIVQAHNYLLSTNLSFARFDNLIDSKITKENIFNFKIHESTNSGKRTATVEFNRSDFLGKYSDEQTKEVLQRVLLKYIEECGFEQLSGIELYAHRDSPSLLRIGARAEIKP